MPRYALESPRTGQTYEVEFDRDPQEADIEEAVSFFDGQAAESAGANPAVLDQGPAATAALTVPQTLAKVGTNIVGGASRLLSRIGAATTVPLPDSAPDWMKTAQTGMLEAGQQGLETVARGADAVAAEADMAYPTNPFNRKSAAVAGGAAQGLSLLAGGAAGKALGLGNAALTTVPLVAGGLAGANQGIQTAEEIGVESPQAQLGMGLLFGGIEIATERLGGIGSKAGTDALMEAFRKPAAEMLKRAAKSTAGESGEEMLAGYAQDALTWAVANEDPKRPGFTTTGVEIPKLSLTDRAMWEKRGLEALGGAAGGAIFAGAQTLANRTKPFEGDASNVSPPDLPEDTGDLTPDDAAIAADFEAPSSVVPPSGGPARQPILTGVPDAVSATPAGLLTSELGNSPPPPNSQIDTTGNTPPTLSPSPNAAATNQTAQPEPQTITGSNVQTGTEMPVPPPTAPAGAGAGASGSPSTYELTSPTPGPANDAVRASIEEAIATGRPFTAEETAFMRGGPAPAPATTAPAPRSPAPRLTPRPPVRTGVPDRVPRMRESSINAEPVMEGDVITDLRIPRSPQAIAESQRIENERVAAAARLRATDAKARGMPLIADSPTGSTDILDWANENPIYLPPGFSPDRKLPEYESLGRNPLPAYWRQFVASGKQGGNPDTIANRAFEDGIIAEPTADAYMAALQDGIAGRKQYRVQFAAREKDLQQEEKRVVDFEKTQTKLAKKPAAQPVPFEDITTGDRMTIDGEQAVVKAVEYNEDGYLTNVVIEDGKRFGLMQFDPQTRGGLLVDEYQPKPRAAAADPFSADSAPQTYELTSPTTGQTYRVEFESEPQEADIEDAVAQLDAQATATAPTTSTSATRPATAAPATSVAAENVGRMDAGTTPPVNAAAAGVVPSSKSQVPSSGQLETSNLKPETSSPSQGFTNLDPGARTGGFLNADILAEGAALLQQGFTTFATWSRAMLQRFGQGIRDALADIWDNVRRNSQSGAVLNPFDRGPLRAPESGMASTSGAAQNAEPSPGGLSEADAEYLSAIQSGDMEKAQGLVDEVAINAGLEKRGDSFYKITDTPMIEIGDQVTTWRKGAVPEGGYSYNFRDQESEAGVSSYWTPIAQSLAGMDTRPWYQITGPFAGYGSDGEPLIGVRGDEYWDGSLIKSVKATPAMIKEALSLQRNKINIDSVLTVGRFKGIAKNWVVVAEKPNSYEVRAIGLTHPINRPLPSWVDQHFHRTLSKEEGNVNVVGFRAGYAAAVVRDGSGNIIPPTRRFSLNEKSAPVSKGALTSSVSTISKQVSIRSREGGIDNSESAPKVNPESSRAADGTSPQGFTNLDPAARTGGFLNADILAEGAALIQQGFTTFATWSRAMLQRFGQGISDVLTAIWQQITNPQTNAAQNARLGLPQGTAPVTVGQGGFVQGNETQSRFASPNPADRTINGPRTDALVAAEANAWLGSLDQQAAVDAFVAGQVPLSLDSAERAAATLIANLSEQAATAKTEMAQMWAHVQGRRMARVWTTEHLSADPARALRQRGVVNNTILAPIAPVLAAQELLEDRATKVLDKRFEGGTEAAVEKVKTVIKYVDRVTGEELSAKLARASTGKKKTEQDQEKEDDQVRERAENRASQLIYRVEERLRQGSKDLTSPASSKDTINRAFREQVTDPMPWEQFAARLEALQVGEEVAARLFQTAEREAADQEAMAIYRADKARVDRAERVASQLIYRVEERLRQGSKDLSRKPGGDSINQAFRDQVEKPVSAADFRARLRKLDVPDAVIERLRLTAERESRDRAAMRQFEADRAARELAKDESKLAKLLNSLRAKMFPGMSWADIFTELPETQKERQREIYRRLKLDERLRNLTADERLALTNELDKAWQRERRKVFKRELEKAGIGKKPKDREKVKAATPRLLRLMNLGMLNSEMFREALAKEYGLNMIDAAAAADLRALGERIQQAPEGLPRRKLEQQLVERLQKLGGYTLMQVLDSWWTASVLSGWRTQVDIGLSLANGIEDVGLGSIVTALRTGNKDVAIRGLGSLFARIPSAFMEAVNHIATGNKAMMRSFELEAKQAMEGGNLLASDVGRQMWDRGGWRKVPGGFMVFYGRMMTALDHVNSASTREGAKAMALARHPDLYQKALQISPADRAAARQQARLELTGGAEPTTQQERLEESARQREILEQGIPAEVLAEATEVGRSAALQGEPTGLGGGLLNAVLSAVSAVSRKAEELAKRDNPDRVSRAGAIITAAAVPFTRAITGTKFARTVAHALNRTTSYVPGLGIITVGQRGRTGAFGDILAAKQVIGTLVGLSLYLAFGGDEDDEKGIEDGWKDKTPAQKAQLYAQGKQPYTVWGRDAQGRVVAFNYQQWGIAGIMNTVAAMLKQRGSEAGTLNVLMSSVAQGAMSFTDKAQLQGLQTVFGGDYRSTDPAAGIAAALNKWAAQTVGGLIPRLAKDIDMVASPELRSSNDWWQKWTKEVPMLRQLTSGKRIDILGGDILLDRTPLSRVVTVGTADPIYRLLGRLNERDVYLPDPSNGVRIVKLRDGTRRPMTPAEKDRYQRQTGAMYRDFLEEHGQRLLQMEPEAAREEVSRITARLRERAAYQATH